MINKYNKLIEDIVWKFYQRLFKEEPGEEAPEKTDYRIMNYNGINEGPVEIYDRYIAISDILMSEAHKFPAMTVLDYYDFSLEQYEKNELPGINYYNYARKKIISPDILEKERQDDLKQSKKAVKNAKKLLFNSIKNECRKF